MTGRDDATERQVQAARPSDSTWLAANAGSGKTRVLTDRVARLLLDNVQPQHILCLTYTKAAASEMQNRLFDRLGEWAMLRDDALRKALFDLGVEGSVDSAQLRDARTLFARAIEAPGGLKIQTIHSFCSSLLRRFPLEAQVSPQFSEIEDRAALLLRSEIVDEMASGNAADAVAGIARHFTGEDTKKLTAEIVRNRELFATPLSPEALLSAFDLAADTTQDSIVGTVLNGDEQDILDVLIPALLASGPKESSAGKKLLSISDLGWSALPVLESVFLNGAGAKLPFSAKLGTFPTKTLQAHLTAIMPELDGWMERVQIARNTRLALLAAQKTRALHAFARRFLPIYETHKQQRGWLDFDDLILKARQLLSDPTVAQWILYRLDGGVDHILVDEAQDTSPSQWDVIEKLAQEFTSGVGARSDTPRTIFVVGDKKQSIYSFQGADPGEFDRMQAEFKARLNAVDLALQDLTLEHSFRSSDAILRLVDLTFQSQDPAGFTKDALHKAFKEDMPGRVDLWPLVEKVDDNDSREWFDPVDQKSARHQTVVLAERIARHIKGLVDQKEMIPTEGSGKGTIKSRPVQPGDFLILVQRRSDLFQEIIRACKAENLPIAGADRLKVGAETAVKDLAALLSFLATPEDNLSLATVLRSPLCGWSEQALFDLSHRRTAPYLWQALREQKEKHPETLTMLNDLRGQTDFLRPFELIERILTRHKGRQNLLARLGHEAEDGINALLSQALAYERSSVPSLTGFLIWMQTGDLDIKRQMDSAGNRVRVMTVHGAKGLESPVVILPDTGKRDVRMMDEVIVANNHALWRTASDAMPAGMVKAREAQKQAQINERLRLLYVAMTRAEKWLIVAAAGDLTKDGSSWYEMIETAMEPAGAGRHEFEGGAGLRLSFGDWAGLEPQAIETRAQKSHVIPEFFAQPVNRLPVAQKTLSPSDLGGAKALPGEPGIEEDAALKRGRQIHLLLEILADIPDKERSEIGLNILSHGPDAAVGAEAAALVDEVRAVLTSPDLSRVFNSSALVEAPITAALGTHRIHGAIDRLIVRPDSILAIDFKTNSVVPDGPGATPEGLLRQMGAYAHALAQVYPERRIETAILWTKDALLSYLPHDLVRDALKRTPYLDDVDSAS